MLVEICIGLALYHVRLSNIHNIMSFIIIMMKNYTYSSMYFIGKLDNITKRRGIYDQGLRPNGAVGTV